MQTCDMTTFVNECVLCVVARDVHVLGSCKCVFLLFFVFLLALLRRRYICSAPCHLTPASKGWHNTGVLAATTDNTRPGTTHAPEAKWRGGDTHNLLEVSVPLVARDGQRIMCLHAVKLASKSARCTSQAVSSEDGSVDRGGRGGDGTLRWPKPG